MVPNKVDAARSWLKSRHIVVPNDWVEACIEWICEENQGQQQTQLQINNLVYEQWLFADLHELQSKCLPDDVLSSNKFQLTGTYALQIDSLVDVGQPYYSQLQKIKGTENANVLVSGDQPAQKPWEPKPTRMLMMKLTDGTNNVQGMEFKTIASLNPKLNPGTKILVQGSVLCRHGVLMLKDSNVQLLGGEVDTLMETNTQEKLLQEALDSSGQNAGKELKQEFDGGPVRRDQKTKHSVSANVQQQNDRPQQNSHIPYQPRGQNHAVRNRASNNDVKQEPEWEDDFALDELMDDMDDDFEMNQPGPSTSNTNRNSRANDQGSSSSKTNPYQTKSATGGGDQVSLPVKQEINIGNTFPSTTRSSVCSKPNATVQTEIDMENSFLANLKSRSFSSSTPLKPFEKTAMMNQKSVKSSTALVDDRKFTADVPENMEMDDFEDDLDDFDLASVDNSIPVSNINQNTSITSPTSNRNSYSNSAKISDCSKSPSSNRNSYSYSAKISDCSKSPTSNRNSYSNSAKISDCSKSPTSNRNSYSNSAKISDCSKSVQDILSGDIDCKLQRQIDIPDKSNRVSISHSSVSKVNTIVSPKTTGALKTVKNTMDNYLTSPSSSIKQHGAGYSPGQKRPAPNDDLLEKFNKVKSSGMETVGPTSVGIHTEPFTYLSLVRKQLPAHHSFTCKVKAYVSTLNGRLECSKGDKWTLSCKINDGTGSIDVDLSNQVLTILIGFSAKDSMEMRKRIKQDPGIRDVLAEGIQQCQQKLIELLCIMEINVNVGQQRPEVVSLIPVTNSHMTMLRDRVYSSLNKFK